MKLQNGNLYASRYSGKECVLIGKKREKDKTLVVIIKFVGNSETREIVSREFIRRFALLKGAGKHIRIKNGYVSRKRGKGRG